MSIPPNKPLRAVIWCAVSSKVQAKDDRISLPFQEAQAREWCKANNAEIVAVLKVPGYSRRESDVITALEEFAAQGIYAYQQLREMWQRHDFDVLIAYSHDRLGRSNTLHSFVVENTILSGAQLCLLADGGFVDLEDFRYKLAIGGMMAAAPVDKFVQARKEGMKKRAARGLPISSRIPMSHVRIRDPKTGEDVRLEVDESKRRLWNDLAALLLEGVSWSTMEQELHRRFGHTNEAGESYYGGQMYRLVMKPLFWGHVAMWHNSTDVPNGFKAGRWVFDESVPVPDGVYIQRNTVPAVWTGELAERVQAEIIRRMDAVRGHAKPRTTHRFTGLTMCVECGCILATFVGQTGYRGLICKAATTHRAILPDCHNSKIINEKKVIAYVDTLLKRFIESENLNFLDTADTATPSAQTELALLQADILRTEQQITVLIREQAAAAEDVQPFYRGEITKLNQQFQAMKRAQLALQQKAAAEQRTSAIQQAARAELRALTLEEFWQQDSRVINQTLHRLMGKKRLVVDGGQIVGVMERPRRNRRPITNRVSQE